MSRGIDDQSPQPPIDGAQRPRIEGVTALASDVAHTHQTGIAENTKMLRDRRLRNAKRLHHFGHRPRSSSRTARRVLICQSNALSSAEVPYIAGTGMFIKRK